MPRQLFGQHLGQHRPHRLPPRTRLGPQQMAQKVHPGRQVQPQSRALAPIVRDLQHRRPRQPAMGEQNRLVKPDPAATDPPRHRHPGQRHHPRQFLFGKSQRHEARPRLDQRHPEGFRQPIAKRRRPHLRDRLAATGHHHALRPHQPPRRVHLEPRSAAPDLADRAAQPQRHAGKGHVGQQQRDDLPGRAITKQLPQRLFVPANPRPVDPRHEIPLAVPFQRRQREPRVLRDKPLAHGPGVGEIAPPAARDADFLARSTPMFHHQHPPPAPPGLDGGKHARRPGADDDTVKAFHGPA